MFDDQDVLNSLMRQVSEGVIVADQYGKVVYYNDHASELLNKAIVDTKLEQWAEVYGLYKEDKVTRLPHEDLPLFRAANGECVQSLMVWVCSPDGQDGRWLCVRSMPLCGFDGKLMGGLMVFNNANKTKDDEKYISDLLMHIASIIVGIEKNLKHCQTLVKECIHATGK